MHGYIVRNIEKTVLKRLATNPAVALLGARQVGKSTLAKRIIQNIPNAIYLDLEKPSHLAQLEDAEFFFQQFSDRLICLDEIQRVPEIFSVLRSVIDSKNKNGQFLLLGSASRDLIRQSSESLAGRLSYIEITPLHVKEIVDQDEQILKHHWYKGGYPRSYLQTEDESSNQWRKDYIQTYLERDIPQLGFNIPANTLGRFWRMLAHNQGQILNASKLAESMSVSAHKIRKYIDLLEQTFITRNLQPYHSNLKKRLVKSPKVYVRDSGLLHSLLSINSFQNLFSHPVYGSSFEGYVIENILSNINGWQASFYRSSNGAEIDLVIEKGLVKMAIEIKASSSPKVSKGFWSALKDIQPQQTFIVAPVEREYRLKENVSVIPMLELIVKISKI